MWSGHNMPPAKYFLEHSLHLSSLLSTYTSKEDGACIFNVITPQNLPFCPWYVNVHTAAVISSLLKFGSVKRKYQISNSHQNMVCLDTSWQSDTYTFSASAGVFGRYRQCGVLWCSVVLPSGQGWRLALALPCFTSNWQTFLWQGGDFGVVKVKSNE